MENKIKELKERFRSANEKEMELIDKEMEALSNSDNEQFSEAFLSNMKETNREIKNLNSKT